MFGMKGKGMKRRLIRATGLLCCLGTMMISSGSSSAVSAAAEEIPKAGAVLINTCLITNDVRGLAAFYAHVLRMEPHNISESYVEFRTGAGVLALFAAGAQEKFIPGSATAGHNQSAILEFRVSDPDGEYARLRDFVKWVQPPTTHPWGMRSIYFRDPDGNLVDFFASAQK